MTDDGTKKSLKGLVKVIKLDDNSYTIAQECTWKQESEGELQVIYEDGKFYNQTTLTQIREKLK